MSEEIRTAMKQALVAFHIHAAPEKILSDLSVETVLKCVSESTHTIWDLIHHMTFWQDLTLDAIDDKDVDWERSKTENWPAEDVELDQSKLDAQIQHFLKTLEVYKSRAETVDLDASMKSWPQATKIWALQMIAQHNSYHLGQIVNLRQLMGKWKQN